MGHNQSNGNDRRTFLQAGAVATASALGGAPGTMGSSQDSAAKPIELPRRPLGTTGVDVTILDQGTGKGPDVDRLLRFGCARGVRSYDPSETYHSEAAFKRWFAQDSAVRKQIFLVTKDAPKVPGQLMGMLDKRLAALGTDYFDLFFIHSYGDYHKLDDAIAMVKSKVTYHEHHGDRALARRLYAETPPEARDGSGADLEAARAACHNRLDFARLLPEEERRLA